jgi:hypothetical protein
VPILCNDKLTTELPILYQNAALIDCCNFTTLSDCPQIRTAHSLLVSHAALQQHPAAIIHLFHKRVFSEAKHGTISYSVNHMAKAAL